MAVASPATSAGGAGEVVAELVAVLSHDVRGLIAFHAPALGDRSDVDGVEAERVVQSGHEGHGIRVVGSGRERSPPGRSGG